MLKSGLRRHRRLARAALASSLLYTLRTQCLRRTLSGPESGFSFA
jgi:hypothetical protein